MRPLHVVVVHCAYQQRGGEDVVVESEVQMLQSRGHRVTLLSRDNEEARGMGTVDLMQQTLWSRRSRRELAAICEAAPVDILHAHNTFPLVSPSVYWEAASRGIPVVQTLHNFRLACPQAMLLREGKVCEDCVGKVPWRGAVRGCYRQSVASSTVLAGMLTLHRAAGTWSRKVTRYIALNDFCRRKFIEAGLPQERILVKANFVRDAAPPEGGPRRGLLFVGRLSPEKGVQTLSDALAVLPPQCLRAAGTGPQADLLAQAAGDAGMLGALDAASVRREMGSAIALVLPSIWYENFPRTLVEAFSCGLPVIASRIGALAELVQDGVTGLLVEPSSASDLAAKMRWALEHPEAMREMGNRARAVYEAQYTEARNHEQLMAIYREAMDAMRAG